MSLKRKSKMDVLVNRNSGITRFKPKTKTSKWTHRISVVPVEPERYRREEVSDGQVQRTVRTLTGDEIDFMLA